MCRILSVERKSRCHHFPQWFSFRWFSTSHVVFVAYLLSACLNLTFLVGQNLRPDLYCSYPYFSGDFSIVLSGVFVYVIKYFFLFLVLCWYCICILVGSVIFSSRIDFHAFRFFSLVDLHLSKNEFRILIFMIYRVRPLLWYRLSPH